METDHVESSKFSFIDDVNSYTVLFEILFCPDQYSSEDELNKLKHFAWTVSRIFKYEVGKDSKLRLKPRISYTESMNTTLINPTTTLREVNKKEFVTFTVNDERYTFEKDLLNIMVEYSKLKHNNRKQFVESDLKSDFMPVKHC